MHRSWSVVAWLSATAAAVTVSWLGVRLGVAPAITDEAPVAIDVNRRYTELRFGTADVVTTHPATRPAPSRTTARPPGKPSTPAVPRPTLSRTPTATPSASPSPTAPDRRPRYRVTADGGVILVAYSPSRIDVVDADPLPGYLTTVTRRSDTLLVVRLTGPSHTSIITTYWNAGPGAQIVEEYGG
jgi:hypothetical protein